MGLGWSCTLSTFLEPEIINGVPRAFFYLYAVINALALAVVIAPILTWLYGWRVTRLITAAGNNKPVVGKTLVRTLKESTSTLKSTGSGRPDAESWREELVSEAHRCERDHRLAITHSTLAFALTAGTIYYVLTILASTGPSVRSIYVDDSKIEHGREMFFLAIVIIPIVGWLITVGMFTGMAWPMALLGMRHPRYRPRLLWLLPVFILVLLTPLVKEGLAISNQRAYWIIFALPICLVLVGLGSRHQRNAMPMLTGAIFIPLLLWQEGNAYGRALSHCIRLQDLSDAELVILTAVIVGLVLLMCAGGAWGSVAGLRAAGRAYRRKHFSDAQYQMLSWFVLTSIVFAVIFFEPRTKGHDVMLITLPILVFSIVYWRSLKLLTGSGCASPMLLLLRVFGDSSRQERLLDEVARYWRFIGPICLIGGPDLAKANLEPHELLAFMASRTDRGFITDDASLARCLDAIDRDIDPDSRYRVNEFYCSDRIWVKAVEALINCSNAILIDLREFTASRAGTAIELSLLSRAGALERTIAVVGPLTDMAAVRAAVRTDESDADATSGLSMLEESDRTGPDSIFRQVVGKVA